MLTQETFIRHETFNHELLPHERILWIGKPQQGLGFSAWDIVYIPISLIWLGFVLFMFVGFVRAGIWVLLPFMLLFFLFGSFMVFGRFLMGAWRRAKTEYALTNERAIIVSGILNRTTRSINLRNLANIAIEESGEGRGAILFGRTDPLYRMWSKSQMYVRNLYGVPAFEGIEDVRSVYHKIQRAQADLNTPTFK